MKVAITGHTIAAAETLLAIRRNPQLSITVALRPSQGQVGDWIFCAVDVKASRAAVTRISVVNALKGASIKVGQHELVFPLALIEAPLPVVGPAHEPLVAVRVHEELVLAAALPVRVVGVVRRDAFGVQLGHGAAKQRRRGGHNH